MKKLVLEITSHAGDGHVTHRSVESFPATLGRGYHNDIIIGDPHISAQHLRIDFDGTDFSVHDLGSENGIELNDKAHRVPAGTPLKSGDTLRLGRTVIRVFDPAHPVSPALRLARANPVMLWLAKPLTVWTAFAMAITGIVVQRYYESWDLEVAAPAGSMAATAAVIIIVWSAIWGVAGKLVRHKSRFRSHVALFSLFCLSMVIVTSGLKYVDFLSTSPTLPDLLEFGFTSVLCLTLLYGSLTLATDMTQKRRRIWTGVFAVGTILIAAGMAFIESDRFVSAPEYSSGLQPYLETMASAESVDGFMKGNEALFPPVSLTAAPAAPVAASK